MNRRFGLSAALAVGLIVASLPVALASTAVAAEAHIMDDDSEAWASALSANGNHGSGTSASSGQTLPWGISRIHADDAWATSTGATVKVAVIDTGIQADHPDLKDNIKGGTRFYVQGSTVYQDSRWGDDNGHGTHVAGTIAARDNTVGVVGVAPNVELYAVKVLDKFGNGPWSAVAAGVRWAADNGMDVASMSLGGAGGSWALYAAVDYALAHGVVLIASSGNSGDGSPATDEISYPAGYDGVIAVGATSSTDAVASFSSSAPYVTLCAPGVSVYSTYKSSRYATLSGTSMAAPHVAGAAALVLATTISAAYDADSDGAWDPAEVKAKLQDTATDIGAAANSCGAGLVDAAAAVA